MENATKVKLGLFVACMLLLLIVLLVAAPKQCGSDEQCFNTQAMLCKRAAVRVENLDNTYVYEVRGRKGEECIVKIVLEKVSPAAGENLKTALEGKGMLCAVPLSVLQEQQLAKIENINDYCTGPLKEVLLEISLENLYEIVVKQIGPLAVEFRQSLESLNTTS